MVRLNSLPCNASFRPARIRKTEGSDLTTTSAAAVRLPLSAKVRSIDEWPRSHNRAIAYKDSPLRQRYYMTASCSSV